MKEIDHFDLDGHSLALFLAVIEERSVTAAAARLGITQSAVSHGLDRLRRIVGDPLFVRSGRGIVATAHAQELAAKARGVLDGMRDFARAAAFDPKSATLSLTVAANDLQRDLLLPRFLERVGAKVAQVSLRVIPSDLPQPELLRENRCDLLITPLPPAGTDILRKRLARDRYVCFHDPAQRRAPRSLDEFLAARHITVVYPDNVRLNFDKQLEAHGVARDIAVSVPNFAGAASFLRGSAMLATLPSLLRRGIMAGFAWSEVPIKRQLSELPLYLAWHARNHKDPTSLWLRAILSEVAAEIAPEDSGYA
jgi:DNA-binding transcriptional LysR family regulator